MWEILGNFVEKLPTDYESKAEDNLLARLAQTPGWFPQFTPACLAAIFH